MQSIQNVLHEISTNHKAFRTQWGITERELEETPESTATTAQGAYIMDSGFQGDAVKLHMALATYLLGHGETGPRLAEESKGLSNWVITDERSDPYVPGITEYSGEMYQKAVKIGLGALQVCSPRLLLNADGTTATIEGIGSIAPITDAGFEEWVGIRKECIMPEKVFWDMATSLS